MTDVGPIAHTDRGDERRLGGEPVPGFAGGVDDVVVGLEDTVGEPILAQILPDVLDRVELRRARGQPNRRDVGRHSQLGRRVPAGAVEDENGLRVGSNLGRDLVEIELHHLSVGEGQRQRCALAPSGADRAEEIGVLIALIGGLAGPRSAPRRLPDKAVLLADARFVLEPDFDRRSFGQVPQMRAQNLGEVFLKAATIRSSCLGWRGRALICEKPSALRSLPTLRS